MKKEEKDSESQGKSLKHVKQATVVSFHTAHTPNGSLALQDSRITKGQRGGNESRKNLDFVPKRTKTWGLAPKMEKASC